MELWNIVGHIYIWISANQAIEAHFHYTKDKLSEINKQSGNKSKNKGSFQEQ